MGLRPTNFTARLAFLVVVLGACSIDASKLRAPNRRDAGSISDIAGSFTDSYNPGRDGVTVPEGGGGPSLATTDSDAQPGSGPDAAVDPEDVGGLADGASVGGAGGGLGGVGGSSPGDHAGAGGSVDAGQTIGAGGNGEEAGLSVPADGPGMGDDGAVDRAVIGVADGATTDAQQAADTAASGASEDALDVPGSGEAEVADAGASAAETGGVGLADGPVWNDAQADTLVVDARGKRTCPTSISGSLDRTDPTQTGRLSRVAPALACGTSKAFPGNGADSTYSHLYDAYHFINATSAPVCFAFTLTYPDHEELYAAAYAGFDPEDITAGYLGDVGDVLSSPQTMGITVGAGQTIDVVVVAVALGTDPAGSYTLSCSAP